MISDIISGIISFIIFFWIRLKNAATPAFWLAAALIPAVILGAGVVFGGLSGEDGLSIQVGVYGDMSISDGAEWTVIRYTDREQMRRDVAARRLELAYAFEEGGITLYTSPATVTDRVTNLMAAAGYLETIAGEIGAWALSFHFEADAGEIQARTDALLADGPLMDRVVVAYGAEDGARVVPFRRLFHGLLALFAQLLAMLCAYGFANKNERDITNRLKAAKKRMLYHLSGVSVVFAMTGAVMGLAVVMGVLLFDGVWILGDLPVFMGYLLVVSGFSVLLAVYLPEGVYPGVLVAGFVFTALMGGVVFDLREVLEGVAGLRFLFPSHYYMVLIGM